jgi:hypothetical protein
MVELDRMNRLSDEQVVRELVLVRASASGRRTCS